MDDVMTKKINKQYFFLSGLHRSGNTVLSSILNQNPSIYVSPLSPVVEFMWRCSNEDFEETITYPNKNSIKNTVSNIIKNFYKDIEKPIVIDRNKSWLVPDNLSMIKKYINENPKIIFTIRPLKECIASQINIMKNHLLWQMKSNNFNFNYSITENDNIAEFLLSTNNYFLEKNSYQSFIDNKENNIIHLVKYDELVNYPEKTMFNIYNFLGIENFHHNFYNIKSKENGLDFKMNYPEDLHKIKERLEFSKLDPRRFLSKEIIEKCDSLDLFYK